MRSILRGLLAVFLFWPAASGAQPVYAWLQTSAVRNLEQSFAPPPGFSRVPLAADSFAAWLRHLPLKAEGAPVVLFDGRARADQGGAAAIVDIDIGVRDLQQCADAVIRLRAEWLYANDKRQTLGFDFTSGDRYKFQDWLQGQTPQVSGSRVRWVAGERKAADHKSLRLWLDVVFTYAGSLSLQRELRPVASLFNVEPGDVLIQGGSPGHAVIVLDVARNEANQPAVLLAQSFMPAQSLHVLRNPAGGVWYQLQENVAVITPDWRFAARDLRRFAEAR
jgi:hypothetical protein